MTNLQRASLLHTLHNTLNADREQVLNSEIGKFGLSENEITIEKDLIINVFNKGIKNINHNQLDNIFRIVGEHGHSQEEIAGRLRFYEINQEYHNNIIQFIEDYTQSLEVIGVGDLDSKFRGVQVATRDDFNTIIRQGFTGQWTINPEKIEPLRIQIASMNENGSYPRGYYINADITEIKLVEGTVPNRYIIHFANPIVFNSGITNVKFSQMPVKYMVDKK